MSTLELVRAATVLPPLEKLPVFGVGVTRSDRYDEVVARIVDAAERGRPLMVSALSVHALMLAASDPAMSESIARADIVTTDGQPVRWAMNLLHRAELRARVCGPTLMLGVCEAAARARLPIFLYGSRPSVLASLRASLLARYPDLRIAGSDPSRVRARVPGAPPSVDEPEDFADAHAIRRSGARLVLVGLGCPLQELWVARHRERLAMPALCVGAAFDFHAGEKPRAPVWMQDRGLEWIHRLASDPRRLATRYLRYNSAFLLRLARDYAATVAGKRSTVAAGRPARRAAHYHGLRGELRCDSERCGIGETNESGVVRRAMEMGATSTTPSNAVAAPRSDGNGG